MSHFSVYVFVPPGYHTANAVESKVTDMMQPYGEDGETEQQEEDCNCVGEKAYNEVMAQVDKEFGNIESLKEKFKQEKGYTPAGHWADWNEFLTPRTKRMSELSLAHPLYNKPLPNCPECQGSGKRYIDVLVDQQYDWYTIGGRYAGALRDEGYFPSEERDQYDDNIKANARKVSKITENAPVPYAIVTPDGAWHTFPYEKYAKSEVAKLYSKFHDHLAVVVDCHS